jgi:16S rRNA (uracil1498-N3)-methyltransferase
MKRAAMPHFYVKPENIKNNLFIMEDDLAHYVAAVRRFNAGDEIMIFDGLGNSYKAKINALSKNRIEGSISSSSYRMPGFTINLFTAIPKGDRFEWLIEKAGELGVSEIIPVNTKRSVSTSFSESKLERYEKISLAASSQCGRNDIMKINKPLDFISACRQASEKKDFINIIPWESAAGETFSAQKPASGHAFPKNANIFIGPEGGFENEEVAFAQTLGIKAVSLGVNILRVETAAIVSCVLIMNFFGAYEAR